MSRPLTRFAYRLWSRSTVLLLAAALVLVLVAAGGYAVAAVGAVFTDRSAAPATAGPPTGAEQAEPPAVEPADPALDGLNALVVHGADRIVLYVGGTGVFGLVVTGAESDGDGARVTGTARYHPDEGGYGLRPHQFTLGGTAADAEASELPALGADAPTAPFTLVFPGAGLPEVLAVSAPEVATGGIDEAMLCLTAEGVPRADVFGC
ncbi:hypothetical protein [Nocardiopsis sp. CC223A]|uniref:hypothetical protein n=1 Tax=Nocardiopsis sp. CC223A TaxID=3044051 RepID=UPI00278C3F6E|nr:hypothetical protein [Nocardiopsis sp. CC223A]